MAAQLRSALLAGFIAGFAWTFIANLAGVAPRTSALIGLGFVIVVAVVTAVIATMIGRRHSTRR